jgi:hypothetical protein
LSVYTGRHRAEGRRQLESRRQALAARESMSQGLTDLEGHTTTAPIDTTPHATPRGYRPCSGLPASPARSWAVDQEWISKAGFLPALLLTSSSLTQSAPFRRRSQPY